MTSSCEPLVAGISGISGETHMKKQIRKKQNEKPPKLVIPAFTTEADEAQWWFKNRSIHGDQMLAATKGGQAQVLTRAKLLDQIAASKKPPST